MCFVISPKNERNLLNKEELVFLKRKEKYTYD